MALFSGRRQMQILERSCEGVTFEDVVRLSREVVAEIAAAELEIFPVVVDGFRDDPEAVLAPRGRGEPVGMGIDFTAVSGLVVAMGSVLGGIAVGAAGNVLADVLSEHVREALAVVFTGSGRRPPATLPAPDVQHEINVSLFGPDDEQAIRLVLIQAAGDSGCSQEVIAQAADGWVLTIRTRTLSR